MFTVKDSTTRKVTLKNMTYNEGLLMDEDGCAVDIKKIIKTGFENSCFDVVITTKRDDTFDMDKYEEEETVEE